MYSNWQPQLSRNFGARSTWLDAAKGWGIALVAFGHSGPLARAWPEVHAWVFSFHVPLFFALSGAAWRTRRTAGDAFVHIVALTWVYVAVSLLFLPRAWLERNTDSNLADLVAGAAYATGQTIKPVPAWFLPCLALTTAVCAIFMRFLPQPDTNWLKAVLVWAGVGFALAATGWIPLDQVGLGIEHQLAWGSLRTSGWPWSADLVPIGVGFMLLGAAWRAAFDARPRIAGLRLLSAVLVADFILFAVDIPHLDLNLRRAAPPALSFATAVLGVAATLCAACRFTLRPGFLSSLGRASLPILVLHNPIQRACNATLPKWVPGWPILEALSALFLCLTLPWVLDRYLLQSSQIGRAIFYPRVWLRTAFMIRARPELSGE